VVVLSPLASISGPLVSLCRAPPLFPAAPQTVRFSRLHISFISSHYDLRQAWILQIAGTLTMASAQTMLLSGGANPKNIVWAVASDVTLGTTSHFEGVILGKTGINFQTGGSMNGRALAQTLVALQAATLVPPS
jgi:Ice-binding-like